MIEDRRANPDEERADLLSGLVDAAAEEIGILDEAELMGESSVWTRDSRLPLRGNIFVFLLAGEQSYL